MCRTAVDKHLHYTVTSNTAGRVNMVSVCVCLKPSWGFMECQRKENIFCTFKFFIFANDQIYEIIQLTSFADEKPISSLYTHDVLKFQSKGKLRPRSYKYFQNCEMTGYLLLGDVMQLKNVFFPLSPRQSKTCGRGCYKMLADLSPLKQLHSL